MQLAPGGLIHDLSDAQPGFWPLFHSNRSALKALEGGGSEDFGIMAICEILEKIPVALKQA